MPSLHLRPPASTTVNYLKAITAHHRLLRTRQTCLLQLLNQIKQEHSPVLWPEGQQQAPADPSGILVPHLPTAKDLLTTQVTIITSD
jgi:hypothetical protein